VIGRSVIVDSLLIADFGLSIESPPPSRAGPDINQGIPNL
jgi:hypothetical protein